MRQERQKLIRIVMAAVIALAVRTGAEGASEPAQEFYYQRAPQTILNRDGGPWAHLDLMTMSVDQLKSHIQKYTANNKEYSIGPLRLIHAFICLNPVGIDLTNAAPQIPIPNR